jgi:hypothetical protein
VADLLDDYAESQESGVFAADASSTPACRSSADEDNGQGLLWKMAICVRGTDHLRTTVGETVHANRSVLWGTMAWGRLRVYEAYGDTQASETLDDHLATHEAMPGSAPAARLLIRSAASFQSAPVTFVFLAL